MSSHVGGVCKGPEACPASTNTPSSKIHGDYNHPALWLACWGAGTVICRRCPTCDPSHQEICYHRLTEPHGKAVDPYKLFTTNFFKEGNELGVDFNLYSSLDDALTCNNPWQFCNYAEQSTLPVGFPRDCGPTKRVNYNWQSETHGGKKVQWTFGKHAHVCPAQQTPDAICHLVTLGPSDPKGKTGNPTKSVKVRADTQFCHSQVYNKHGNKGPAKPAMEFSVSVTPPGFSFVDTAQAECASYCAALGYCCNGEESEGQLLSCAQACMMRKRGSSEDRCRSVVQDQGSRKGCLVTVDGADYDTCSCTDPGDDPQCVKASIAGGLDGCAVTTASTPGALTAVRQDRHQGWGFNVHFKCCTSGCGLGELLFETGAENDPALMNACWAKNAIYCRECPDCQDSHQQICYRRLTDPPETGSASDNYELFANLWTKGNNVLGEDFELYSSWVDAKTCRNPWKYCNYDNTVGFPRDCGVSSYTPYQWQDDTAGSGKSVKWYFGGVHEECPDDVWADPCQPVSVGRSPASNTKSVDVADAQVCFPEPINPASAN